MSEHKKKHIISRFEIILFVICIGIVLYILGKENGFHLFNKEETTTIIENPNALEHNRKIHQYKADKHDEKVEGILEELATQFSKGDKVIPSTKQKEAQIKKEIKETLKQEDITADELKFYEEKKTDAQVNEVIKDAKDWFQILRTSRKTYSTVKSIFENVGATNEEGQTQIKDSQTADNVYSKMKEMFNISEEDAAAFARKGTKAVSDWAKFVEEKKEE